MNRINILTFTTGIGYSIDARENKVDKRIDLHIYSEEIPGARVSVPGPSGTMRDRYNTLSQYIESNMEMLVMEYHKTPHIRNLSKKAFPVIVEMSKLKIKTEYKFSVECDGFFVDESQESKSNIIERLIFAHDKISGLLLLVEKEAKKQSELSVLGQLISEKGPKYQELLSAAATEQLMELEFIESIIDETTTDDGFIRIIKYTDNTFRIHTESLGINYFTDVADQNTALIAMSELLAPIISNTSTSTIEQKIRLKLNACRKLLGENNNMMFMCEMGVIRGMMYSFNEKTVDLSAKIPEEKHLELYLSEYKKSANHDLCILE